MTRHAIGPFELDEDARSLSLRGAVQTMQPKVFDLLAYLVRNAGRVIPKEELMDALWPNINVTEASLQRAVSLARRALAAGGLENTLRSYVRHGYRFAMDDPSLGNAAPKEPAGNAELAHARSLAEAREWAKAAEVFARLDRAGKLAAEDYDLWALAVECGPRPPEAIPMLARAITAYSEAGKHARAARSAVTLGKIEVERGRGAVGKGWLERAAALLSGAEDPATRAYLLWMRSRIASSGGQPEEALALASAAYVLAEKCGEPGLSALILSYKGFFNIALGKVQEGTDQQNHAAAIALSSQVDPVTGSLIYCNILWSCRTYADWSRGRQWSEGFESWCEVSYATTHGACDLHRAEVVGAQRGLNEALAGINGALPKLASEESWALGDGYRVRGDIHAMIGDLGAARDDYSQAYSLGWDGEPGSAILLFETGDVDGALAALERALQGVSWFHLQRRGLLLVNAARIAALGGRPEEAKAFLAEIEAQPERWQQPAVQALILETKAALAASAPAANRFLVQARQLWSNAGIEYQSARVRLLLAKELLTLGDLSGASVEIAAAERTARTVGSLRILEAVAALQPELEVRPAKTKAGRG